MSTKSQNDWDVIEEALVDASADAVVAFERLRELTAASIAGLIARITELEAELALRAPDEGWPEPAKLQEDYWESAQ